MRIETIGLPGAGKTTLEQACRTALEDAGKVAVDPNGLDGLDARHPRGHRRIWRNDKLRQSYHISTYLAEYVDIHGFMAAHYGSHRRNIALSLAVGADISRYEACRDRLHSFWVGEGMLHLGSVALLGTANWNADQSRGYVNDLVDVLPRPDLVLYLQADPATATEALMERMARYGQTGDVAEDRFNRIFGGADGMIARAEVLDMMSARLQADQIPVLKMTAHGDREEMRDTVLDALSGEGKSTS